MKIANVLCLLMCLVLGRSIFAHEVADINLEITSEKPGAEAKQDAFDQATEEATRRWVEELLGPEKAAAHWTQIKTKLIKNSTRYVLFIKGSQPVVTGTTAKVSVQLRLSPDALESMLRELGVFGGGSARVLALVRVKESRGSQYVWWADAGEDHAPNLAQEYFKRVYTHLNAQFKGKSIFVLDPLNPSFRLTIPAAYRSENLKREDQALLAQYLKADVVLSGRVDVSRVRPESAEHNLEYDLQLWQARNGRPIAEASRRESMMSDNAKVVASNLDVTDKRVFSDLATKLAEAAGNGNLNLSLVNVVVAGDLGYREQREIKNQLGDLREVRAVRERLFEPGRVTYEVETPVAAAELAKAVQRGSGKGQNVGVEVRPDNSLVLTPAKQMTR